jgi:hypothetical protein
VGDGNLFWTDAAHGTVMRAPSAGGAAVVVATGQDAPTELGLFGDSLYWIDRAGARALMSVSVAGGTPSVVVTAPGPSDAGAPACAPPGINGFTVASDGTVYVSSGASVYAVPVGGGPPVAVVEFACEQWPAGLAIDGATLVMTNGASGRIYAAPAVTVTATSCGSDGPKGSTSVCAIAGSYNNLPPIFAQGGRAYWVSNVDDALDSVSTTNSTFPFGKVAILVPSDFNPIATFTLRGATAFVASEGGYVIETPLVEGSAGTVIAVEPSLPPDSRDRKLITSIAADDAHVFWSTLETDGGGGSGTCVINAVPR